MFLGINLNILLLEYICAIIWGITFILEYFLSSSLS